MESQQAVQNPGGECSQDKGKSSHYPSYRRTVEPESAYSDSFRITGSRPTQLSSGFTPFRKQHISGFTPFRKQHISGQESPFFPLPGSFQEKTRKQREKQDFFQPKEERVRPNDPEAVGLGERDNKESEIAVNNFRISCPY
ncbi:hypothetical protein O181_082409 [Austropuccinia psidii MF-1]|uniref:Uncharacterized protein n=1 Tax=Austropuccinia psidii MF-1 TaxID=1389203 RepID=A0A9Q3IL08_9BASI|nr:hypothetical protein [Austropuccinia psidii MF-1]